jgi:hypothetical protein
LNSPSACRSYIEVCVDCLVIDLTWIKDIFRAEVLMFPCRYTGTLVCQCSGCARKHIVTDHLKLFSKNVLDSSLKGFQVSLVLSECMYW